MEEPLEEKLNKLATSPVDENGLFRSFNEITATLKPLRENPDYEDLLRYVYQRVIHVFQTDENSAPLFYRADYMFALLGRTTEGIIIPEESTRAIHKAFYDMKERHNCDEKLPYEELLEN